MKRVATAAVSVGLLAGIGWSDALADQLESSERFGQISGYDAVRGYDAAQLAALPGYGANAPQIARTDPTTILPDDSPAPDDRERPLGLADSQLYRQIFAVQERGEFALADDLIRQLDDRLLIGTVLHQRYMHPTAYRSSFEELADWLRQYHDHAGAGAIYDLAMSRRPNGAPAPTPPSADDTLSGYSSNETLALPADVVRDAATERAARSLLGDIRRELRDEDRAGALAVLDGGGEILTTAETAQAHGLIAFNAFLNSRDAEALEQAALAVDLAGAAATDALWAGGLAAWRSGDYGRAQDWFAMLSRSPYATRWTRTAAAYWGARSCLRGHRPGEVSALLRSAAEHPDTFYGMLAQHALGMHDPRRWDPPVGSDQAMEALLARAGMRRALALTQIGETARGEAEFRALASALSNSEMPTLLAYAVRSEMPSLALRLSVALAARGGEQIWSARYPAPAWLPSTGLQLDRATVLAIMRQESAFRPDAESWAGARGLMQLMPRTAQAMAQRLNAESVGDLDDPANNMALGQQFVQELRSYSWIGDDILKILVAYNGGPGNLRRWMDAADYRDDPLLFIESIRAGETRDYVERVMANLGAYRLQLGQPTPELDDLVAGRWPRYQDLNARTRVAARPH